MHGGDICCNSNVNLTWVQTWCYRPSWMSSMSEADALQLNEVGKKPIRLMENRA